MDNNQLPIVTYEQARRLKKAGFDWPVYNSYYFRDEENYNLEGNAYEQDVDRHLPNNPNSSGYYSTHYFSAPTVALALEYVRDVLDVPCAVEMLFRADTDGVNYQGRYVWAGKGEIRTQAFGRYRDAASKLLDMILNEL